MGKAKKAKKKVRARSTVSGKRAKWAVVELERRAPSGLIFMFDFTQTSLHTTRGSAVRAAKKLALGKCGSEYGVAQLVEAFASKPALVRRSIS